MSVTKKVLPWAAQFNHPNLAGEIRLLPLQAATADASGTDAGGVYGSPVQLGVSMTSSHPVVSELLQQLGPVLAQVLPVLIAGLIAGSLASPAPSSSS